MRNLKLTIAYDGTDFKGWQIQRNGERTVQGELQRILEKILCHPVKVIGSGRTDTGVHARQQVANVLTSSPIPHEPLMRALNNALPVDLVVYKIDEVPESFHARYSIKQKTYRYTLRLSPQRDPLQDRFNLQFPESLNLTAMRQASKILIGAHDFQAFQSTTPENKQKNSVRTLTRLTINKNGDRITITLTAEGFLYKMARNIVGTLILAGKGELKPSDIMKMLTDQNRAAAPKPAPAHGLCLWETKY